MIRYKARSGFAPVRFDDMVPLLTPRPYILFIDRDGTLVPISSVPAEALLPQATADLVSSLAAPPQGYVVIVSARGLAGLKAEFDASKLVLAGNYGLEISFPSGRQIIHPDAAAALPELAEVSNILKQEIETNPLLLLDDHNYSLCLHYHRVPSELHDGLHANMEALANRFARLKFRKLPTSIEVVPPVVWDKGYALDLIAEEINTEIRSGLKDNVNAPINPLYMAFGDSHADEPMFAWVNSKHGLSFNVGSRESSEAIALLEDPADLYDFLQQFKGLTEPASGKASDRTATVSGPAS
jgi:trehalose-phosphatase